MKPPFEKRCAELEAELAALRAYPPERLAATIREVGFACDCCGRCCTRACNDHVFLLDRDLDAVLGHLPGGVVPAPYYELADQHGRYYVSGYALRTREDGSCIFLEDGRCTHYADRPTICRVYPYMLHREAGEDGRIDWRQVSGLDQHGLYHEPIGEEEAEVLAGMTIAYEAAFLEQLLAFYRAAAERFAAEGLRYIRKLYDDGLRAHAKGRAIEVLVYRDGAFEPHRLPGPEKGA